MSFIFASKKATYDCSGIIFIKDAKALFLCLNGNVKSRSNFRAKDIKLISSNLFLCWRSAVSLWGEKNRS